MRLRFFLVKNNISSKILTSFLTLKSTSPQAPRILQANQGVNIDPANEIIPRVNALLAPETYLRTPPTFKSKVYLNLGKEEYRGISKSLNF